MANIELKIVALGDFSSVNAQIKNLQKQVEILQKSVAGVGLNTQLSSQLRGIQQNFESALVSSGNFKKTQVQLTSETQKFGKALESGKLSLGQYFGIITGRSASAQKSVQALAVEQVKLNNSIIQTDITKQGVYSVYTPTKINELSHSTEIAAAKQNIYNLAVKEGSTQLINFGKNTQWAGRQLTVGLAVPAILFGTQAVTAFKAVNVELTRLQRLYGEGLKPPSQASINQISGQVLALGKNIASSMGIAQSETVKVAANFAAMGKQGQNLLDITTQTQRLSKLGAIDATQATNTIVSLQNVYKVSTIDLANAVNFMSSMQKQTTMSLQDMTDAIPRVGPIMAQLGGTYKDTAVMLLAMREAGIPAAQAANALKSAIASIIAPTHSANKQFASFGINLDNIRKAGTPVQMIEALQSSLVRLSPLVKEQLIEKLFGKFQFARVSALLDNFGKVGSQTQNALKVAGATNAQLAGLAGQEMQQATQSTTAKWQRAVETLKADLYPIGQKILEFGTKIISFGQKIADFFNKLPGPIKSGLGILLTLGVLSGPVIMITGLLANLMGQVMKVGYGLLGIVDGTKKWKDLMTPASIAAKSATQAFNEGLLTNVASVDALNSALQRMITSLEEINTVNHFSAGSIGIQSMLPGMASGGFVPGSGNKDSYPAMLMPGEAVIPKSAAQEHAPFINAMINGSLPGYANGLEARGGEISARTIGPLSSAFERLAIQSKRNMSSDSGVFTRPGGSLLPFTSVAVPGDKDPQYGNFNSKLTGSSGASSSDYIKWINQTRANGKSIGSNVHAGLYEFLESQTHISSQDKQKIIDKIHSEFMSVLSNASEKISDKDLSQMTTSAYRTALQPHFASDPLLQANYESEMQKVNSARYPTLPHISKKGIMETSGPSTVGLQSSGTALPIFTNIRKRFRDRVGNLGLNNNEMPTLAHVYDPSFLKAMSGPEVSIQGAQLGSEIDKGARSSKGIDAHSPSKKAEKTGKDYVQGLKVGLEENAPQLNTAGEEAASQIHSGINEGLNGSKGQAKIRGIFSKFSNMGMAGRMSAGMGLGMMAQVASPILNKMPGGNLVTDAMTGAGMGAAFGPWGMAAGAALSVVTGGIKSLMAMEKLHSAESQADFKSSADAIQFLGGTVADVTNKMTQFNVVSTNPIIAATHAQIGLAKGIQYSSNQLQGFNALVKSLSPDNPLSLIIKQVKSAGDSQSAGKLAEQFATAQMAINGISQQKATQLAQLIMTISGHDASATSVSASNQINAIKASVDAALPNTKQLQQVLGQLITEASNTSSLTNFDNIIKGIGASAGASSVKLESLLGFYKSIGDVSNSGLLSVLINSGKNWSVEDLAKIQKSISNGNMVNVDSLTPGNVNIIGKSKTLIDLQSQLTAAEKKKTDAINGTTAAIAQNVSGLTAQQKLLEAQLKTLQDLQKQKNRDISYATTREDLKNQILMAQATGDNLKAQLLQQQLFATTSDYKLQTQIDSKQKQVDSGRLKIDSVNAVASAQLAATKGNNAVVTSLTTSVDNLKQRIDALLAVGGIKSSVGTGGRLDPLTNVNSSALGGNALAYKGITGFAGKGHTQEQGKVNSFLSENKLTNGQFFVLENQLFVVKGNQFVRASVDPAKGDSGALSSGSYVGSTFVKKASGGHIRGPGSPTSDSIPAMLSNGEYVINAGSVAHYGQNLFDSLNTRKMATGGVARTNSSITYHKQHMNKQARHFAMGGLVPSAASDLMALSRPGYAHGGIVNASSHSSSGIINHNKIEININGAVQNPRQIADEVMARFNAINGMNGRKTSVGV